MRRFRTSRVSRPCTERLEPRSLLSAIISSYPTPTPNSGPDAIVTGPDGNLWFTESAANQVGYINPTTHVITEVPLPSGTTNPLGISSGPEGDLWFIAADATGNEIDSINPTTHAIQTNPLGVSTLSYLTTGPDGRLYYETPGTLNSFYPTTQTVNSFVVPDPTSGGGVAQEPVELAGLATGPDGNIWFTFGVEFAL
jgi:virginiamycin B lyase